MAEAHDSWLGTLGVDVDQIRNKIKSVVSEVETAVEKKIDTVVEGATQMVAQVESAAAAGAQKIEEAGGAARKKVAQVFAPGAESGPMAPDCKPVRGQVPGPAEHRLCQTHGHIVDVNTRQIVAASLDDYKRRGVAAGGGLLKKAKDLGEAGLKAVGEAAGPVSGVDLRSDISGGLNSPSYVNAQNSPANLDGPNASAGDSYFVTGGQKGQLVQRAKDLKGAATSFYELGTKLQEKGVGGTFEFKDDKLIASGKNVTGIAAGMTKLASAIDSWTGGGNKESIEKGSKAVEYVSKLIDAVDALLAMKKLNLSAEEVARKPSQASVEAWADDVGNAFDKAGGLIGLIPSDGIPGLVVSYYTGLLSAPKNYIAAFKTIMHARYDKLDMEAGISGSNQRANNWGTKTIEWEGDLVPLYVKAYFQPSTKEGKTLQAFMKEHRKSEGADLYRTNLSTGKALLGAAIARVVPDESDDQDKPSTKVAWLNFVQGF